MEKSNEEDIDGDVWSNAWKLAWLPLGLLSQLVLALHSLVELACPNPSSWAGSLSKRLTLVVVVGSWLL